jgi:predicted pyridoxine 5'-phosphate oxidase superfamily flavin-nucleotide-binding protein
MTTPVLAASHAQFIVAQAVSMALSSRDADNRPSIAKAAACRISTDRLRVTLLVDQQLAADVLRDLRAGHADRRRVLRARHPPHAAAEGAAGRGQRSDAGRPRARAPAPEATVAHLLPLGYPEAPIRSYFAHQPEHLVAVSFTPTAAFEQTPGPGAGRPLAHAAD